MLGSFGVCNSAALRFLLPESPRVISPPYSARVGVSHITPQVSDLFTGKRNGLLLNFSKARPAQGHLESPELFLFAHFRFPCPPTLWIEAQDSGLHRVSRPAISSQVLDCTIVNSYSQHSIVKLGKWCGITTMYSKDSSSTLVMPQHHHWAQH